MVRYIPTQVPAAMSRLIASTLVAKPPTWYAPVINNPPPAIPLRRATRRNRPHEGKGYDDLPTDAEFDARREGHASRARARHTREPKQRPRDIVYAADHVRRQFFADFPFEALRPHSLVEADTVRLSTAVDGAAWTALSQRGAYPTIEDTVEFTLNLHAKGLSLSHAYKQATDEFIALRAAHEMATLAAQGEAVAYGAEFKRSEHQRTFDKEARILDETAASRAGTATQTGHVPTLKHRKPKVWTADVVPGSVPAGGFTGGKAYAARWRLPPPVRAGVAAGDLLSAIQPAPVAPAAPVADAASTPKKDEEEMDDLELMAAILGKN
ncbi:hypothetical protein CC85DRAFT_285286 [Cutaneotrichosporon oleaginosum]|uniref:Small ribosomal subunit protein mS23 n=1 Tax=Cutaneotrichosporon oleaginosum TaxID=879819 RepID=A0A0J1B4X8_9TREE|nr:uncharacterized protein CC85DRAFT_285286 [Cutaneotrichosporon oleaginosum]KLT42744.1 hypothetical protein CC85DRAFT_285286 [Cutaneotrichosporon oleaginosum]TXT09537.1 hypothetical protein COLE_03471 [Cutaneotrichosporon oleaginosum]